MSGKIIFHIDVNNAYLSMTAVKMLQLGETTVDIREIPSIIGGNTEDRHGIVLAKSEPAKKYKIITGEPIVDAKKKCPHLKIFKPDYSLYMKCSNDMYNILMEYSPLVQRYSIDENFMCVRHFKDNYLEKAKEIKDRIRQELGFNVNIGISNNKLLAKMASDFKPNNSIHTLFPEEIEKKMWILPVEDLFMVGRATKRKLDNLNITTIGELANYDVNILKTIFKSHGKLIHDYANGIDNSEVRESNYIETKGLGNSTTIARDIATVDEASKVILSLTESVANRLRGINSMCRVVSVSIKTNNFTKYMHQKTLENYTDSTEEIYKNLMKVFLDVWNKQPIRQIGVRVTGLCSNDFFQVSLFDNKNIEKQRALDKTIDSIRNRYGSSSIIRSSLINSGLKSMTGGVGESDYPVMSSIL